MSCEPGCGRAGTAARSPSGTRAGCRWQARRRRRPGTPSSASSDAIAKAYEQIASTLRGQILEGELPRGTRLPNETVLAEEVEVHVPPFQAIYDLLQAGELPRDGAYDGLSDIVVGRKPGRRSDDEIIVCVNPGSGVHDVAVSRYVYQRAMELGLGTDLPT